MATILINGITHREACLFGCGADGEDEYDSRAKEYFARLEKMGVDAGHCVRVDEQGSGPKSYSVYGEKHYIDLENAHTFMQFVAPEFWA